MGLAASQARFLGLTARKSNVEYQGQQINQARTALSNEVMGLYNQYAKLEVPVAPSVNDYNKIIYKVDSTYENYQVNTFEKILDGPYLGYYDVDLLYMDEVSTAYPYVAKDSVISAKKNGDTYDYLNFVIGTNSYTYDANDTEKSTIKKITGDYDKYQGLTTIMKEKGLTDGTFYMYSINGINYYTSEQDLNDTTFTTLETGELRYEGDYRFDYQGVRKEEKHISTVAMLDTDISGRLKSIQFIECDDDPALIDHTYSITTSNVEDQQGYDDAMNQYHYKKDLYERETELLNQKTKKLQAEDRSLELKLNQLNTEQKAITTEMDSVSETIKNTIDKVFKTYDG